MILVWTQIFAHSCPPMKFWLPIFLAAIANFQTTWALSENQSMINDRALSAFKRIHSSTRAREGTLLFKQTATMITYVVSPIVEAHRYFLSTKMKPPSSFGTCETNCAFCVLPSVSIVTVPSICDETSTLGSISAATTAKCRMFIDSGYHCGSANEYNRRCSV